MRVDFQGTSMSDVSDMDVEKVPVRGAGYGRNEEGDAPTPSKFAGRVSSEKRSGRSGGTRSHT